MAGFVYPLRVVLLAIAASSAVRAQTATPPAPTSTEASPSAKLTRLFSGAPPKYDPPKPQSAPTPPAIAGDQPRNRIIRLPTYIVRDKIPVPDEYEILTQKGRNAAMAQRYLGPKTDAERVLNSLSLTRLWKSIPVLGQIPFVPFGSMTYEERAALIYERLEQKRRFDELMSIEQFAQEADKSQAADKTKNADKTSK